MTANQIAEKLTADILRSILDYDPETGKFDWRNNRRKAGCLDNFGYHRIQVLGKLYKTHRLAWLHYYGEWPEQDVDHVNGVRSDNRIANLRSATKGQQSQNVASPDRKSGLPRGVSWCAKSKGYRAQIRCENKTHYLGIHPTPDAASAVYREASLRLHGEFSVFRRPSVERPEHD